MHLTQHALWAFFVSCNTEICLNINYKIIHVRCWNIWDQQNFWFPVLVTPCTNDFLNRFQKLHWVHSTEKKRNSWRNTDFSPVKEWQCQSPSFNLHLPNQSKLLITSIIGQASIEITDDLKNYCPNTARSFYCCEKRCESCNGKGSKRTRFCSNMGCQTTFESENWVILGVLKIVEEITNGLKVGFYQYFNKLDKVQKKKVILYGLWCSVWHSEHSYLSKLMKGN